MQKINLIISVAPVKKSQEFIDFFKSKGVRMIYACRCDGTAKSKTLSLLGLEKSEMNIIHAMCLSDNAKSLLDGLAREMGIDAPGAGVAITLPIDGALGIANAPTETEDNFEERVSEMKNSLIVVIAENGYVNTVMDAAREAGARGGTVIHAKGTKPEEKSKLFGITIADEKEMIYIVSTKDAAKKITDAIIEKAGPKTKAKAVVFTLPIENIAGFAMMGA